MEFKRYFVIKRIENKDVDIAGEEETQKMRIVSMESLDGRKITLKGKQDQITGFITGDNVEVRITSTQTELFNGDEELDEEEEDEEEEDEEEELDEDTEK